MSDIGLTNGKAIRVDYSGSASLNMGNWYGGTAKPLTFAVTGGVKTTQIASPNAILGEDGRVQAYKFCFDPAVNGISNDCITDWTQAGGGGAGTYVLKAGDTMTGQLIAQKGVDVSTNFRYSQAGSVFQSGAFMSPLNNSFLETKDQTNGRNIKLLTAAVSGNVGTNALQIRMNNTVNPQANAIYVDSQYNGNVDRSLVINPNTGLNNSETVIGFAQNTPGTTNQRGSGAMGECDSLNAGGNCYALDLTANGSYGESTGIKVYHTSGTSAIIGSGTYAINGQSTNGYGGFFSSTNWNGIRSQGKYNGAELYGGANPGDAGVVASGYYGVQGNGGPFGGSFTGYTYGVVGNGNSMGIYGSGLTAGVYGYNVNTGSYGYLGYSGYGVYGSGQTYLEASTDPVMILNHTGSGNPAIHFRQDGATKAYIWTNGSTGDLNVGNPGKNPALTVNYGGGVLIPNYTKLVSPNGAYNFQLDTNNSGDMEIFPPSGSGNRIWIKGSTGDLNLVGGNAYKPSGGSWGVYSDARLKDIHGTFDRGLSDLMKINTVNFSYKKDNPIGFSTENHVGVIAQNVQQAIPEAVTMESNGYLSVNNDPIIWTMLNSIKELKAQNDSLKSQLDDLNARVSALEAKVK